MKPVGIVGTGLMGTAVAKRLRGAGFPVHGLDADPQKAKGIEALGGAVAPSVAALVAACNVVFLCVFDTQQVEDVVEGKGGILEARHGRAGGVTVVCTSTCDPDRIAALAGRLAGSGVRFIEMPVSGTSLQVANGDGVGLVAGERADADAIAPVLDAVCPSRHYIGAAGNGGRAKLAVNLVLGLNRGALAEGLVLAERLGLDPVAFLGVLKGSAAYSQVMDVKGEKFAKREFDKVQSRVDQSLKDFTLMLEQARARGQALPFASVYVELLKGCVAHGEAQQDNAAILAEIARRRTAGKA